MKIEIRAFRPVMSMSEETIAFTGTLYLDGKKCGRVSNQGHGGPDSCDDIKAERRLEEYAKTLPPVVSDLNGLGDAAGPYTYAQSAESIIGDVVSDLMDGREMDKMARRLKKRIAGKPKALAKFPQFVVALNDASCDGEFIETAKGTAADSIAKLKAKGLVKFRTYDSATGKQVV